MGLVVLSLCDGISTGQEVLKELGLEVDTYFASEIDKYAIQITQNNFQNTVQIGDITQVKYLDGVLHTEKGNFNVPKVDLILSGTPCVSFSIAGKKENMQGVSGKLFYEFVRILNEINPTYFFFENVRMADNVANEISEVLGVDCIYLNSVDFSCHIRKRYYWTNIVNKEDCLKGIIKKELYLKDIVDDNVPFTKDCSEYYQNFPYNPVRSNEGVICVNPHSLKMRKNAKHLIAQTHQRGRIYDIEGKCPTICASLFDLKITKDHIKYRKLMIEECEKLQGLPIGYTKGVSNHQAGKALGNGWQVDTVKYILSYLCKNKG